MNIWGVLLQNRKKMELYFLDVIYFYRRGGVISLQPALVSDFNPPGVSLLHTYYFSVNLLILCNLKPIQ